MFRAAKKSYKITNWARYNEPLVQRGDITFWFSDETIQQWEHSNDQTKVDRPFVYSDTAIETMLALRELFRLPYRQTEGLGRALIQLMQVDVKIPDYTSLAKRAIMMEISLDLEKHRDSIDIVVDSTGLKVYGEGEWKTRIHGRQKHRIWRKLHLAINPETQEIVAELLLENRTHDSETVDDLTDSIDDDLTVFSAMVRMTRGTSTKRFKNVRSMLSSPPQGCEDQTTWQFVAGAVGSGCCHPCDSPVGSQKTEGRNWLSYPFPCGNHHVSFQKRLRR